MRDADWGFRALALPARLASPLGCLVAAAIALLLPMSAQAANIHVFDSSFTPSPQANNPNSVAVDDATGSVYVMSTGGTTPVGDIQKYSASGTPENFSSLGTNVLNTACGSNCRQIAIDNSGGPNQGVIYVSSGASGASAEIETYLSTGVKVASIKKRSDPATTTPFCGVSVDDDGAVYTTHSTFTLSATYIDKFEPLEWATNTTQEPPPVATIRPLDFTEPCKLAIDTNSSAVVMAGSFTTSIGNLRRFPGGAFGPPEAPFSPGTSTLITSSARHPAIDLSNDHVYVSKEKEVARYNPAGTLLETFGVEEDLNQGQGVAVNSTNGTVYVSDRGTIDRILIYKQIDAPVATIDPPTNALQFTVDVSGEVDPDGAGEIIGCKFEYVKQSDFLATKFNTAQSVPCEPAIPPAYSTPQQVEAEITGLSTETTYMVRTTATNADGTGVSAAESFTTHAVQDLQTGAATDVGPREVRLHGSFTGIGDDTDYYFQYGKTTSYDQSTPIENAGETTGPTTVSTDVTGLELETGYNYRIVAVNSSGTSFGQNMTFETEPAVAGVETLEATDITQEGVKLQGEFEGNGAETHYYFEYGPTTAYGLFSEPVPGTNAGSPVGPASVSTVIGQFEGYSTYHYRLVASNSFGETRGSDRVFTTLPAPLPEVYSPSAEFIGPTSATLSAFVNPNRWPTVYLFEWGPTTSYGSSSLIEDVLGGMDNEALPVQTQVNGLSPGTVYHFRIVAINFTGTTEGPNATFATPDRPGVESTTATAVGQTSASLTARVVPNASPTTVRFEYGTTGALGGSTTPMAIGSGMLASQVERNIDGLTPGTTYYLRAVADNGVGTSSGPTITFTTQPASPSSGAGRDCRAIGKRAKESANRARRLSAKASKARGRKRARTMRAAAKARQQARKLSGRAKVCRKKGTA